MPDKLLATHTFCFNKHDNGGESLVLKTEIYANGDPGGIFWNQILTLHSYCNSASLTLCGASLTPDVLRDLANQLENIEIEAIHKTKSEKL
jgi:hypothetical protein